MGGLQVHYEVLGEIFQEQFNKVGKERCKKVDNYCKRERFLSRLFGIFNEEIVDIWCQNKEISPYTVDKLFWLIGSGNFHRSGIQIPRQKKNFIKFAKKKLPEYF